MTHQRSGKYDVCIVGLKCYDYLTGASSPRYLGGVEKDLVTLARMLVDNGLSVAMLTFDHGQSASETVNGVDVLPCYEPGSGWPVLRFFYPRAYRILRDTMRTNAAVTVVMGAGSLVAWAALACRLRKRARLVFLTASDSDCERELPLVRTGHEKTLYRLGLSAADVCYVQSAYQQEALRRDFNKSGEILRIPAYAAGMNASTLAKRNESTGNRENHGLRVAWIGRLSREKRPGWLSDIADQCPDVRFTVAGSANIDSADVAELQHALSSRPNIEYLGKVSPDAMRRIYVDADYILNTSEKEGFPAVFREAWYYGVPIVSTVDPDSLIANGRAGIVVSGKQQVVEFFRSDQAVKLRAELSRHASTMYRDQFSEKKCLEKIMEAGSHYEVAGIGQQ